MLKMRICVFWVAVLVGLAGGAETLVSPNGRLRLDVGVDAVGIPVYELSYDGRTVIAPSRLGVESREASMAEGFRIVSGVRDSSDTVWNPVWGEYAEVRDNYRELALDLEQEDAGGRMVLRFKLYDDGMGFRYEFPEQSALGYLTVTRELTEFCLDGDHTFYCIPGDYDTDEFLFTTATMSRLSDEFSSGKYSHSEAQPISGLSVQTPLLIKTAGKRPIYINIHEANLRNYGALSLMVDVDRRVLSAHITPDRLGVAAYVKAPFCTPWRTVMVSDDACDILASQLIFNLNEPCALERTDWIKPRKFMGVWWEMFLGNGRTWAYSDYWNAEPGVTDYTKLTPNGRHAANADNVRRYIDFAAESGIPALLVEGWNEGWEDWSSYRKNRQFDFCTPYPDFPVDSLQAYATSKGVRLIMHHETAANAADYEFQLDTAFRFMRANGYDAVKTGYVGAIIPRSEHHSSQWMVNHVLRVAQRAAEYGIMVDSHEAVRPTGLCRTYPNWVAQESARGGEFEAMQGNPPEHTCILPFTRLKGGPMDYTPGLFEMRMSTYGGQYTHTCGTTLCRQLALYLTMPSPLQMACDLPENYRRFSDAFEFIKQVPVDWADSRYLEAEPGDYITVARRDKNSDDWYVGSVTDENARSLDIPLDFLSPGVRYEATIYADAKDADYRTNPQAYEIESEVVMSGSRLRRYVAPGGGLAVRLHPVGSVE